MKFIESLIPESLTSSLSLQRARSLQCRRMPAQQRRFWSWILSLAFLLGSLAPVISQAIWQSDLREAPWAELCTALRDDAGSTADGKAGSHLPNDWLAHLHEHCPFCVLHAPLAGLPPALPFQLALLQQSAAELPFLFLNAPVVLFVWRTAQPRAPPLVVPT